MADVVGGTGQAGRGTQGRTLSVAIVCKSNEATIGRAVASVRALAMEIVALDSGSTDRTVEILEAAGARVQHVSWAGYVKTKQQACEACSGDWVLLLDSDESVEPDLAHSLRAALQQDDPAVGGYAVNRKVWYAGDFLHYAWQPEWRVRLIRRSLLASGQARVGGIDPHDALIVEGLRVERLPGTLRHDTLADVPRFLAGQLRFAEIGARMLHARGVRGSAWRLVASPLGAFLKQLVRRGAWRDGWRGWIAAGATACHALMKHLILLERSHRKDAPSPPPL